MSSYEPQEAYTKLQRRESALIDQYILKWPEPQGLDVPELSTAIEVRCCPWQWH